MSIIDVKIAITRYEAMIAKHEATQEMYSPKITKKCHKIPEHHKHVHATNPYIKKFIYLLILIYLKRE